MVDAKSNRGKWRKHEWDGIREYGNGGKQDQNSRFEEMGQLDSVDYAV